MICINVSKSLSITGIDDYELRINDKVIASFRHKREEGLAKCLQLASEAAERAHWATWVKLMNEMADKTGSANA